MADEYSGLDEATLRQKVNFCQLTALASCVLTGFVSERT